MGFVNKIMLMGNMTRDPEVKQLPSGTSVCEFGMATNRTYKTAAGEEKQETVFVDCTAFGRTGEVIAEYCPKGRPLFIEGRLHYETWEDKTGNRRSKLSVMVEQFQFVGNKADNEGGGDAAPARQAQQTTQRPPARAPAQTGYGQRRAAPAAASKPYAGEPEAGPGIPDEDIPFAPNTM